MGPLLAWALAGVLTVSYHRLRVGPGDRLLDLGSGGGRHAFEAMRLGASVVAVDSDRAVAKDCAAVMTALLLEWAGDSGTGARGSGTGVSGCGTGASGCGTGAGGSGAMAVGNGLDLPFPPDSFDRVIAAEVLEHVPDDRRAIAELVRVLRPGGTLAVTVPRWFPELVCWALSDDYHQVPGGHIRIYRRSTLMARLTAAGLQPYGSHHAHGLHAPYWWLKCLVGVGNDEHPLVQLYHRLLVWDISAASLWTRIPDRLLNPVIGKSLVVYLSKPSRPAVLGAAA